MHILEEGTRIWAAQAANSTLGAEHFVGEGNVVAILPCRSCYTDLRATAGGHRPAPAEIALIGTICRRPLGLLIRTDTGRPVPVITAGNPGAIAVPLTAEEPVP